MDEVGLRRARRVQKAFGSEDGLLTLWQTDKAAFEALIRHAAHEARKACGDFDRRKDEENEG